ncbi:DUF6114 domain-containing protein [Nonomuraea candida]|uniref:DUF6114 domain-containing protein n=1 Tax=Nonomuraea candida TaxID=359159 RepID=UPI000A9770AF|nr:DUF6114 domain-containing protein [Nonomuraea candida]
MLLSVRRLLARSRDAAAAWTGRRPFWAGGLLIASGAEIALIPVIGTGVIIHTGVGGYAGFLLGFFLAAMGAGLWFAPEQRFVLAVLSVMAALSAFVLSNLGGFLVGSLLAIGGASLGFAWMPREPR